MTWYNIWKWPIEIYEDIRLWFLIRKALREDETIEALKNFKYELRIDKIGRIYTVINIPEELWPYDKQDQVWPWMVEQLRELDDILLNRQLNELVYPDVTRIAGSPAYLVVLAPSSESISLGKFLRWIFNCAIVYCTFLLLNKICLKAFHQSIIDAVISLLS